MEWLEFADRAIRVPFREKGRDYSGWDCWGLVCCGYRDVLGIELPSYTNGYQGVRQYKALARLFRHGKADGWEICLQGTAGAVAAVYRRGNVLHVGIVMPDNHGILHCEEKPGTVIERPAMLPIEGYYVRA